MDSRKHVTIGYHPDDLQVSWNIAHSHATHRHRVEMAKPYIVLDEPESFGLPFLKTRLKAKMDKKMKEDVQRLDNTALLRNIHYTYTHKHIDNTSPRTLDVKPWLESAREKYKAMRVERIKRDNSALAHRIDQVKSTYSKAAIAKERAITDTFPKPKRNVQHWSSRYKKDVKKIQQTLRGIHSRRGSRASVASKGSKTARSGRPMSRTGGLQHSASGPMMSPVKRRQQSKSFHESVDSLAELKAANRRYGGPDPASMTRSAVDLYPGAFEGAEESPLAWGVWHTPLKFRHKARMALPENRSKGGVLVSPPPLGKSKTGTGSSPSQKANGSARLPEVDYDTCELVHYPKVVRARHAATRMAGDDCFVGEHTRLLQDGSKWVLTVWEVGANLPPDKSMHGDFLKSFRVDGRRESDGAKASTECEVKAVIVWANMYENEIVGASMSRLERHNKEGVIIGYSRLERLEITKPAFIGTKTNDSTMTRGFEAREKAEYFYPILARFIAERIENEYDPADLTKVRDPPGLQFEELPWSATVK